MARRYPQAALLPLYLVVLIDMAGNGLILPLLGPLFLQIKTGFFHHPVGLSERHFAYGLTLGLFALCTLVSAPILGQLSDQWGRKRVLAYCLIGTCVGYWLMALGVVMQNFLLFFAGRMLSGLMAGSLPLAQAAVMDLSSAAQKTAQVGKLMFFAAAGYTLGPMIGGFLSDPTRLHWFAPQIPLLFAAVMALVNLALLWRFFTETFVPAHTQRSIRWLSGLYNVVRGFTDQQLRYLIIAFLCLQIGWAGFFQFINLVLIEHYHFAPAQLGWFLALLSVGYAFASFYVVGKLAQYFSVASVVAGSLLLLILLFIATILSAQAFTVWLLVLPIGAVMAISYSSFISLFSAQVSSEHQGWMMGLTASVSSLSFGVVGVLLGLFTRLGDMAPLWFSTATIVVSALLFIGMRLYRRHLAQVKLI